MVGVVLSSSELARVEHGAWCIINVGILRIQNSVPLRG